MVLETNYPPDIRVDKEAAMLMEHGHEIMLLCKGQNRGHDQREPNGIVARYVARPGVRLWGKAESLYFYVAFHNPFWERECDRFVRDFGLEALHVHDLPLVGTACAVAARYGIPVVADLHDR